MQKQMGLELVRKLVFNLRGTAKNTDYLGGKHLCFSRTEMVILGC